MENLLLDALAEVVGDRPDEHALRERGNLACWDNALHLRIDGGGLVLSVDGDTLPLLQDFTETFRQGLGGFDHLSRKDVADGVHHHGGFLVVVVAFQLGEVLKAQHGGNLVASGGGNQVVRVLEVNRGQLVYDYRGFEPALLVHEFYDVRVVQFQCRPIDVLAVGIVAHAKDFQFVGIVDVERVLVVGHDPVELRGNHA